MTIRASGAYIICMDTQEKLELLSRDSQYDLACACGTKNGDDHRTRDTDGERWLYPVSLPGGGSGIMLKTLISNVCANDCKYCPLRAQMDTLRCSLNPEETARVFMDYNRRRKLLGLFLTSGVIGSPDATMQQLCATADILRRRYQYRGYIHLKVLPGSSPAAIEQAMRLASAVSLNLETPTVRSFACLSDRKDYLRDIVEPFKLISRLRAQDERFRRIRQTTQFIVGASDETDREIITASWRLYQKLRIERVYFSAYQKGLGVADLPGETCEHDGRQRLDREHRLYQADFLFRRYGWSPEDIPYDGEGRLSLEEDPKLAWARLHPERFPVNLARADKLELLRVPGIGPTTAARILKMRKEAALRGVDDLPVKGKRLEHIRRFAHCGGNAK